MAPTTMQIRPIEDLPDEILQNILQRLLSLDHCHVQAPAAPTFPEVITEVKVNATSLRLGERIEGLSSMTLLMDGFQKKGHINVGNRTIPELCAAPLAVSSPWYERGTDILLRQNGFVEISTDDPEFVSRARWFGLNVWTLDTESSRPESIVEIVISPNDKHRSKSDQCSAGQYRCLVNIREIKQLGRFLMRRISDVSRPLTNSTEYRGKCLRIHVHRDHYNRFCTAVTAFDYLLLGPFLAGLMESISNVTISPLLESYAGLDGKLQDCQTISAARLSTHGRDLMSPAIHLVRLVGHYDSVRTQVPHVNPEAVLLRILEFSATVLHCKVPDFAAELVPSAPKSNDIRFLTEVLRVAAFETARLHFVVASNEGRSIRNRSEWMWKALRFLLLAVTVPTADPDLQGYWKTLCFIQLMRGFGFVGLIRRAWECIDKALDYAAPASVDGVPKHAWKAGVLAKARDAYRKYIDSNIDGEIMWDSDPVFRHEFMVKIADTEIVLLLHRYRPRCDEITFPRLENFFKD